MEEMYKWSMYNIVENDKEGVLVYNTLSKKLILIKEPKIKEFEQIISETSFKRNDFVDKLIQLKFVVPYGFNEKRYCDFQYYKKVFSGNGNCQDSCQ